MLGEDELLRAVHVDVRPREGRSERHAALDVVDICPAADGQTLALVPGHALIDAQERLDEGGLLIRMMRLVTHDRLAPDRGERGLHRRDDPLARAADGEADVIVGRHLRRIHLHDAAHERGAAGDLVRRRDAAGRAVRLPEGIPRGHLPDGLALLPGEVERREQLEQAGQRIAPRLGRGGMGIRPGNADDEPFLAVTLLGARPDGDAGIVLLAGLEEGVQRDPAQLRLCERWYGIDDVPRLEGHDRRLPIRERRRQPQPRHALLERDDGIVPVRREDHGWKRAVGGVIGQILGAVLLVRPQDEPHAGRERDPQLLDRTHRIERRNSRALIVRGAAADELVGLGVVCHLIGVVEPSLPLRDDVQMREDAELRVVAEVGAAGIVIHILHGKAVAAALLQHHFQRLRRPLAEGHPGPRLALHAADRDQVGQVLHHLVTMGMEPVAELLLVSHGKSSFMQEGCPPRQDRSGASKLVYTL